MEKSRSYFLSMIRSHSRRGQSEASRIQARTSPKRGNQKEGVARSFQSIWSGGFRMKTARRPQRARPERKDYSWEDTATRIHPQTLRASAGPSIPKGADSD